MTSNSDKLRSLFLTALMVFSVFAGTVALSGTAAAGNSSAASSFTVSPSTAAADEPVTHSWTTGTDGADTSVVADLNGNGDVDSGEVLVTVQDNGDLDNDSTAGSVEVTVPTEDLGIEDSGEYTLYLYEEDGTFDSGSNDGTGDLTTDGSVAFTDLDTSTQLTIADGDALNSGGLYYSGQTVYVSNLTAGEQYRLRTLNSDDEPSGGSLLTRTSRAGVLDFDIPADDAQNGLVLVNSSGYAVPINDGVAREPNQVTDPNYASSESFDTQVQDLRADFDSSSTGNDGSSATTDFSIESNAREDFDANVSAQGDLDTDDLEGIFGAENVTQTYPDDDTVTVRLPDESSARGDYTLNFTDIDADTYTFNVNVTDTDASDSDTIEVTDTGDAEADFTQGTYRNEVGDVVNVSVEMSNTDTATLQIGERDNSNYAIVTEVVDDDEDGVAYVEFNSFTAGSSDTVLTAGDDDTELNNINQGGSFSNSPTGNNILQDGDYNMFAASGEYDGSGFISDDEDNRGRLTLLERSTDSMAIWTASEDSFDDLGDTDADGIAAYADANNLTQDDTIARDDTVVVQVQASGLEGALAGDTDSEYASKSSAATLFNLSLERQSGALNAGGARVDISNFDSGNYSVVVDDNDDGPDSHYVVINSDSVADRLGDYEDGDEYKANFTVFGDNGDNELASDTETVNATFNIEDPELELDTNADERIELAAGPGSTVTGTTNFAPGTEIEVEVSSENSDTPFVERNDSVIVQDGGTFSMPADYSEYSVGSTFTVLATLGDVESDEIDGELVEFDGTVTTPDNGTDTDTTTDTDTDTTTDTDTDTTTTTTTMDSGSSPTEGGDANETDETETTGGSGPGFTAAIALIALVAAALLAVRRDN